MKYEPYHIQLVAGDVIAVAYRGAIYKGLFLRYGKQGNIQYLLFHRINTLPSYSLVQKRPIYVDFINTHATNRIVKIHEDYLTPEELETAHMGREYILKTYF